MCAQSRNLNRLANSLSPYLLQHAGNPVDWWPWSDEAFDEARRRDVPVFLSIGYATCHWCHVMEDESFEDYEAALALNEAFVCIKVDREERPDVDGIYMEACLALNGHGGWPLTALLTPDREPFYVGTYLPRESRGGRIGVIDLAESVSRFWAENPDGVRSSAAELASMLVASAESVDDSAMLGEPDLAATAASLRRRFDPLHGGFGTAPKFPTPHHVLFLLRRWHQTGEPDLLEMAVSTLRAIRRGGVFDQIGGGLHRYSTDREWLLPHFEKMLYDQAMFAIACTEAFAVTREPDLREAAEFALDYVLRELTHPGGAFLTAEDADSLNADGQREEGAFYVWTPDELVDVLGSDDGATAAQLFGVTGAGNFLDEATRQRTGANVLHRMGDSEPGPPASGLPAEDAALTSIRDRLLERRAARPRPLLDDKVLTDWNGLAIAAFAVAGRTFGRADYVGAAGRSALFVLRELQVASGLLHRHRNGESGIRGMLDDYAFLAWGLIELYQSTFEPGWLAAALRLHREMGERFHAPSGGYFVSEEGAADLIARRRALRDGALPSGNSVAVLNGLRLALLSGDEALSREAETGLQVPEDIRSHPAGYTFLMSANALHVSGGTEVVVAGDPAKVETQHLILAVRDAHDPFAVTLQLDPAASTLLHELAPFTAMYGLVDGSSAVYVCRDHVCMAPVTSADEVADLLKRNVPAQKR